MKRKALWFSACAALAGIVSFTPLTAIYKEGWIDLNKNGKKDIYEDPK